MLLGNFKHAYLFPVAQAWSLACSSEWNKKIYPARYLAVNKGTESIVIDSSVPERCDERGTAAPKNNICHNISLQ